MRILPNIEPIAHFPPYRRIDPERPSRERIITLEEWIASRAAREPDSALYSYDARNRRLAATIFLEVRRFIRELDCPKPFQGLDRRRYDRDSKAASLSRRSGGRFNPKTWQRHKLARK
jgi:hypothetical protein